MLENIAERMNDCGYGVSLRDNRLIISKDNVPVLIVLHTDVLSAHFLSDLPCEEVANILQISGASNQIYLGENFSFDEESNLIVETQETGFELH